MVSSFGYWEPKSSRQVGISDLMMLRGDRNLQCSNANDSRGGQPKSKVIGSMRKVHLVCSLLLAFGASMLSVGCDAPKADNKMSGPPPSADAPKSDAPKSDTPANTGKKATGKKPKGSGASSTTGGGVEVPPAGGTTEKPADEKPADAKPVEEKAVEEKAADAKPEAKPEEKTEEKKPE